MGVKPHGARTVTALLVLALLGIAFVLVAVAVVYSQDYADTDFFTFWLGARMRWSGLDPYVSADWLAGHALYGSKWIANPVYPYPLPLAALTAPLGALPLATAYVVWVALSLAMITNCL